MWARLPAQTSYDVYLGSGTPAFAGNATNTSFTPGARVSRQHGLFLVRDCEERQRQRAGVGHLDVHHGGGIVEHRLGP